MNGRTKAPWNINRTENEQSCKERTEEFMAEKMSAKSVKSSRGPRKTPNKKEYHHRSKISFDRAIMDNRGQYKHLVHMMSVPYRASRDQIREFFAPLNIVDIRIVYQDGRRTGEVDVAFASQDDVQEAMKKDRDYLEERWIKLINVSPGSFDSRWGNVSDIDYSQEYRNRRQDRPQYDFNRRSKPNFNNGEKTRRISADIYNNFRKKKST